MLLQLCTALPGPSPAAVAYCAAGELSLDSDEASPLAGSPQEADEFEVTDADLDFSLLSPRDAATKRFTSPGCDMTFRRHALSALLYTVDHYCVSQSLNSAISPLSYFSIFEKP
jgi:hypothetical protein